MIFLYPLAGNTSSSSTSSDEEVIPEAIPHVQQVPLGRSTAIWALSCLDTLRFELTHLAGKSPFLVGLTLSTGCFATAMLVFRGVPAKMFVKINWIPPLIGLQGGIVVVMIGNLLESESWIKPVRPGFQNRDQLNVPLEAGGTYQHLQRGAN